MVTGRIDLEDAPFEDPVDDALKGKRDIRNRLSITGVTEGGNVARKERKRERDVEK